MSYASRPMGDYKTYGYAGDPGFLSGIWKVVKKVARPLIGGMIGGPVGAVIAGAVGGASAPRAPALPAPPPGTVGGAISFPGGTTVSGAAVLGGVGAVPAGMCPTGYHLAKDGSGRLVRNRRMNVANPKALRKAIRRTEGFVKLAKRALKGTGYAVRRA